MDTSFVWGGGVLSQCNGRSYGPGTQPMLAPEIPNEDGLTDSQFQTVAAKANNPGLIARRRESQN